MNLRTTLALGALLVATAIPTVASAQRYRDYPHDRYYGRPVYRERVYNRPYYDYPSYSTFGLSVPLSVGGVSLYFGNGYDSRPYYGHRHLEPYRSYGYRRHR